MPLDGYRRVCARIAGVLLVLAAVPSAGGRLFSVASDAVRHGWGYALCSFGVAVALMLALVFLGICVFSAEEERWPPACLTVAVVLLLRLGAVVWTVCNAKQTWNAQLPFLLLLGFSVVWMCLLAALTAGVWDFPGVFRLLLPMLPGTFFLICFLFALFPFLGTLGGLSAFDVIPGLRLAVAGDGLRLFCLLLCGVASVLVGVTCGEDCG